MDKLADGGRWSGNVKGQYIVVVRIGDDVFAFEDRCPHAGAPLSDGRFHQGRVTCRHHQWQFDIRTGEAIRPKIAKLKTFPVKIDGDNVLVEL